MFKEYTYFVKPCILCRKDHKITFRPITDADRVRGASDKKGTHVGYCPTSDMPIYLGVKEIKIKREQKTLN